MPRSMSAQAVEAAMAAQTGVLFLQAAEITLSDSTVLRIVNNPEDVSINGQTFTAVGFQFDRPEETDDGFSTARITLDNTDQWFTASLRSLFGPVTMTFFVVSETDLSVSPPEFDNIEFQSRPLLLRDVQYNASTVRGTLYYNDTTRRAWPHYGFTPQHFPGLF